MSIIIRVALLFVICMTFSVQVAAQMEQIPTLAVEYGDLRELVGKNHVFVHTENLESRRKIEKELMKFPQLKAVGRIEDAYFLLVFGSSLVRTSPNVFDNFASTSDSVVVYGDMVAMRLVRGRDGTRTRILWYTRKRQTFLRTDQFFRPSQFNNTRSNWIGLIGSLWSSNPKWSWIPISRATEIKATRDFIKALKKMHDQSKLTRAPLFPPVRERALGLRPRRMAVRKNIQRKPTSRGLINLVENRHKRDARWH